MTAAIKRQTGRGVPSWLLTTAFLLLVSGATLFGQTVGDYQSYGPGPANWGTVGSWERWNGSSWVTPLTAPTSSNNVKIRSGHTIVLDATNRSCNNLEIEATGQITGDEYISIYGHFINNGSINTTSSSIRLRGTSGGKIVDGSGVITTTRQLRIFDFSRTILSTANLTINTDIEYEADNLVFNNYGNITLNGSLVEVATAGFQWTNYDNSSLKLTGSIASTITLNASANGNTVEYSGASQSIKVPSGSTYYNLSTSTSGTKTLLGNTIVSGDLLIGSGTTLDVSISNYGIAIAGDWTNANAVGGFTARTGTVTFNGTSDQTISHSGGETFYRLLTNKPSGLLNLASGNITVSNRLTMTSGNINSGSQTLIISNPSTLSLSYSSGTIIGRLSRRLSNLSYDYLFPIGTSEHYRPATFYFTTLPVATYITAEFDESLPGSFTSYSDGGVTLMDAFQEGFWHFNSSGTPGNLYNLTLTGNGFTSYTIDSDTRISGRNASSTSWQAFGSHGIVTDPTVTRTAINNLNTTSFDYCFATPCTSAADAGTDAAICKGASTTLNGTGGGTYSWSPVTGLSNPNIANPVASPGVTTTYTLTVTNGGCVSTDDVTVTVNPLPAAALGYAYQKTITIDHDQVSGGSDLYNFPVLINISSSPDRDGLENVAYGGYVEDTDGYDIIFTDENYNKLDHQVETYTATNGNLVAWVRIPVLSVSSDVTIRILYGNPQISLDPSVKSVWKPAYQAVWHMGDNPGGAAPQLKDAAQSNDGTSNGGMLIGNLVAGSFGNAIHFDGSDDFFDVGAGISPARNFTEQCWMQVGNQLDAGYHGFLGYENGTTDQRAPSLWIFDQDQIHGGFGDNSDWCSWISGSVLINDGVTWNHIVTTFDGTNYKLYVNGSEVFNDGSWAGRIPYNTPVQDIGRVDNYFTGNLDEVRVLSEALSPGWIATEFNNQDDPSTFYSVSGQTDYSEYDFEVCENEAGVIYSVQDQGGHTYSWTVTGGSVASGAGTNEITVDWGASGTGHIQLTETFGVCSGSSLNYDVNIISAPTPPSVTNGERCGTRNSYS